MLREYAVDPATLGRFGPMWLLLEQISVPQGRIVVEFPKKGWTRLVYDAMNTADCPDMEKKKLVEKLNRLKRSLGTFRGLREYPSGVAWLEAALQVNSVRKFDAILTDQCSVENQSDNRLSPIDATADNPLWTVGSPPIPRTPEQIAECIAPLARISKEWLLVDPYLDASKGRLNVLREILSKGLLPDSRIRRIELHSWKRHDAKIAAEKLDQLQVKLDPLARENRMGEGLTAPIRIFLWEAGDSGDVMHARYFLTERGGIRIDYGMATGEPGQTTDVQLLDQATYERRWRDFQPGEEAFKLVASASVSL
jgi:hypothetical protein